MGEKESELAQHFVHVSLASIGNTSILKVSILVSILAELDWGEGLVFTKLGQG